MVDTAQLAPLVLAVATHAIGATRVLQLRPGWREPCSLWFATIALEDTPRGLAFQAALRPFTREQIDYDLRGVSFDGINGVSRMLVHPSHQANRPRGLLLASQDLTKWFNHFLPTRQQQPAAWHRLFRGQPVGFVPGTSMPWPRAVTLAGHLTPSQVDRGLAQHPPAADDLRRLLCWSAPLQGGWPWPEPAEEAALEHSAAAYTQVIDQLLALDFAPGDAPAVPHVLQLSPRAQHLWRSAFGRLVADYRITPAVDNWAARFALLHHCVTCAEAGPDDRSPVSLEALEAGLELAQWFHGQAALILSSGEGRAAA
jgi:hypothetical protein